jgi:hypothetical protein
MKHEGRVPFDWADDVATAHIAMDVAALLKGALVTWVYGLSVQIS